MEVKGCIVGIVEALAIHSGCAQHLWAVRPPMIAGDAAAWGISPVNVQAASQACHRQRAQEKAVNLERARNDLGLEEEEAKAKDPQEKDKEER